MAVKILDLIKVCPGKAHAWYDTALGFKVRKPYIPKYGNMPIFNPDKAIEEIAKSGYMGKINSFTTDLPPKRKTNMRAIYIRAAIAAAVAIIIYIYFGI